ncbi:T9SS type A sorting domain-containing protein [Sungkyunkwania multivorans]|uniref:T9SS type A sorting domain-containing protein n=1 Tax=Sungkyunkwania multivorans TaxID=1173618 RepID=A0ABW3D2L0_9FLAO
MKHLKTLSMIIAFLTATTMTAQWVVTPSTAVSSYSQPNWKVDADLNDNYMAITYGNQNPSTSPGGTGTFLKVFNASNTPITGDIAVFNMGFNVSRVKISATNFIYVLGTNSYSPTTKLVLKKFNTSGTLLGTVIVNHSIGGAMFDLALADNGDALVSLFEGDNIRVRSYDGNLVYKGVINIASGITHYHLPSYNLRSQFIDFNAGKFIVGYSRGSHSSLTSYIKKYSYNTSNPALSSLQNTYPFAGGFIRKNLESNNSHQVALRANGDIFYVNGISGVKRISGATTYNVYGNTKTKVNVDANDNLLISWTDNARAKARLYNSSNGFVHYYQEDGNINGSWAPAFHDCKFVLAGDKSNQGTNYHTNRKAHYQVFNCSDCEAGGPATADFEFRFPNQVSQLPSLYGPQDVTELCLVDRLWVDGTPSCNEDGYFVEITEFNLMTWTDTLVLYSGWVCTGCTAPNNIDIASFLPAGYQLRPNRIYKFKLAVGSPWDSTHKFFQISCCRRQIVELEEEAVEIALPRERGEAVIANEELAIKVFPNPAKDVLTIDLSKEDMVGEAEISIKNFTGRQLYAAKTKEQRQQINISKWIKGIYLCTVKVNDVEQTFKIVKE